MILAFFLRVWLEICSLGQRGERSPGCRCLFIVFFFFGLLLGGIALNLDMAGYVAEFGALRECAAQAAKLCQPRTFALPFLALFWVEKGYST